ncbi:SIR2 family protein [Pedobacter terrae]|uniref:SIR2 family protein n=1 Tax=Pedobacter terrae TaxID=405671 RepID=UPI002FF7995D
MEIKGEDLIFLFGAGASLEAGIPISNKMVEEIEELITKDDDWKPFKDLYFYLRSSIQYSDGIMGKFNEPFNVERLLVVISQIEERERNIMYPFIGTWNIRLLDLAGLNFENVTKFKKIIRKQLNEWVGLRNYDNANYFTSFSALASEIGTLIKAFTLNYDLCFETVVGREKEIELGFTKGTNEWHYSNFENYHDKSYNLYKLHGSIDWYIDVGNKLMKSERQEQNPELIFGIQHKMTSVDPYFYYSSKLREACLNEAKLIVVIGYSYADDYVNNIFSQALNSRTELRILNISPLFGKKSTVEASNEISATLKLRDSNQIISEDATAKTFLTEIMTKDFLASKLAEPDDVPFT